MAKKVCFEIKDLIADSIGVVKDRRLLLPESSFLLPGVLGTCTSFRFPEKEPESMVRLRYSANRSEGVIVVVVVVVEVGVLISGLVCTGWVRIGGAVVTNGCLRGVCASAMQRLIGRSPAKTSPSTTHIE